MAVDGGEEGGNPELGWYKSAFEEGHVGMALIDSDWKFVEVNNALCKILGYSAAEMCEKTLTEVIFPEDLSRSVEKIQKVFGGSSFIMQDRGTFFDEDGRFGLVLGGVIFGRKGSEYRETSLYLLDFAGYYDPETFGVGPKRE